MASAGSGFQTFAMAATSLRGRPDADRGPRAPEVRAATRRSPSRTRRAGAPVDAGDVRSHRGRGRGPRGAVVEVLDKEDFDDSEQRAFRSPTGRPRSPGSRRPTSGTRTRSRAGGPWSWSRSSSPCPRYRRHGGGRSNSGAVDPAAAKPPKAAHASQRRTPTTTSPPTQASPAQSQPERNPSPRGRPASPT